MTDELLAPLHPNESALTPLLQAKIDEGMLREIAEADYGWKAGRGGTARPLDATVCLHGASATCSEISDLDLWRMRHASAVDFERD